MIAEARPGRLLMTRASLAERGLVGPIKSHRPREGEKDQRQDGPEWESGGVAVGPHGMVLAESNQNGGAASGRLS